MEIPVRFTPVPKSYDGQLKEMLREDVEASCQEKLKEEFERKLNRNAYEQVTHVSQVRSGRCKVGELGAFRRTIIFGASYGTLYINGVHKSPGDGIPWNRVQLEHLQYQSLEWLEQRIADGLVWNFKHE